MDVINEFIKLMQAFEERNNISIRLSLCPDGSCTLYEFWSEEELKIFDTIDEAVEFLKNTNYELDENGRCFSPVRIKIKKL